MNWLERLPIERYLHEGAELPFGWGVSRPGRFTFGAFIAPIPLNHLIQFVEWFYWRVLVRGNYNRTGFDHLRRFWMGEGDRRGYEQGYDAGVRHARAFFKNWTYAKTYGASEETLRNAFTGRPVAGTNRPGGRECRTDHLVDPYDMPPATGADRTGETTGTRMVSEEVPGGLSTGEVHEPAALGNDDYSTYGSDGPVTEDTSQGDVPRVGDGPTHSGGRSCS